MRLEIREEARKQLKDLRFWCYTKLRHIPTVLSDEDYTDFYLDSARLAFLDRNPQTFENVCVDLKMFIWAKQLPDTLSDDGCMMLETFKGLVGWLQVRMDYVDESERKRIKKELEEMVAKIREEDRRGFEEGKVEVEMIVEGMIWGT